MEALYSTRLKPVAGFYLPQPQLQSIHSPVASVAAANLSAFSGGVSATFQATETSHDFSPKKAAWEFIKGMASPITDMFKSPQALLKGLAVFGTGYALTVLTHDAILPFFAAIGIGSMVITSGLFLKEWAAAKTPAQKEHAFKELGVTTSTGLGMLLGAKANLQSPLYNYTAEQRKAFSALQSLAESFKILADSVKYTAQIFTQRLPEKQLNLLLASHHEATGGLLTRLITVFSAVDEMLGVMALSNRNAGHSKTEQNAHVFTA